MKKKVRKSCVSIFLICLMGILSLAPMYAQGGSSGTINGNVKDSQGESIIGASVVVKGTTTGTVTDLDGNFQINASAGNTLVISYIGYKPQEVAVGNQKNINIVLKDDAELLSEVVVIGYGAVKKNDLTGSVTAIRADEVNRGAITSADQLIQGKVPGLFVLPGDGGPGAGPTIRIRGGASLNANNDPLYVIDGIPISEDATPGSPNPLAALNPNDIETFSVLKDASAAAIYGSRGSNGVVIITTKKGTQKGIKVGYSSTYSLNHPYQRINTMSPDEFYRVISTYSQGLPNEANIMKSLNSYPMQRTNWQDLIFQTGFGHDQNVNVAGKAGFLPFRVSVGYNNEKGTLKTSSFERYTGGVNLSPKFLNDHLSVDINVKGIINNNRFADGGAVGAAAFYDPTKPVYNGTDRFNGFWNHTIAETGAYNSLAAINPLGMLYDVDNHSNVKRSLGNIQLDYKMHFLPELRANLNMGYDVTSSEEYKNNVKPNSFRAAKDSNFPDVGGYTIEDKLRRNQLLDFYLDYNKLFESIKSNINVMGGYSYQHFYESNFSKGFSNSTEDIFKNLDPKAWMYNQEAGQYQAVDTFTVPGESYLISLFGRLNYTFMDRYLLTATIRRDGSSRFAEANRYGVFPSVALAWRVTEESFMKNQNLFSDLKLRMGYGVTGQQGFSRNYGYIPSYELSRNPNSTYLGSFLLKPNAFIPELKWEETATTNLALDFGFLKGRLFGTVEVYKKKTKDLLNEVNIAAGTNFANRAYANVGNMENKGLEINLTAIPIDNRDMTLTLGYNVTFSDSKITNLTVGHNPNYPGQNTGDPGYGTSAYTQKHMVGYAPYTFFLYQQVYDENGMPVQNAFVDRNGDGEITEADRYMTNKNPNPDVFMGFTTNFKYKDFDLGFNMRANFGNYVFNAFAANNSTIQPSYTSGSLSNKYRGVYDTGFTLANSAVQAFSDHFLENASFLRMDNVTAGYSFRQLFTERLSGRISFSVQNVFTITKYTGLDPENNGVDKGMWPRPRTYTLGLNLNF